MLLDEQVKALKVAEVARRLQVDARTVYGMLRRGELRGVKTGRLWRVPMDSLETFLQASGTVNGQAMRMKTVQEAGLAAREQAGRAQSARVKAIRCKYRATLSRVDEFIARKQEEIALENRIWPREDR